MTYARQFPLLPAGYINTTDPDLIIEEGFLNETAGVEVPLGVGLVRTALKNTNLPTLALPTTSGDNFYGVLTINNSTYRTSTQTDFTELGQTRVLVVRNVLAIRVLTATAVAINDPVYLHFAAGANRGKFRNDNTGTVGILVPNARWKSTLATAGVADLELQLK
jgi:hypothetical protein